MPRRRIIGACEQWGDPMTESDNTSYKGDSENFSAKDMKTDLAGSFKYAFHGIRTCIEQERNMKIHCCAAILVIAAGTIFHISSYEWIACFMLFGLVISLEMINTAIESVVDMVTEEYRPLAKRAKDVAAGAVLVSALFSVVIAAIIFLPKIFG